MCDVRSYDYEYNKTYEIAPIIIFLIDNAGVAFY